MALSDGEVIMEHLDYRPMGKSRQGGFRATYFIYGMILLNCIGFVANMTSMVLYFFNVMHFDLSGSANTLTNYMGAVFMLTLVAGLISDSYMNRLNTALLFAMLELLGYALSIIQSHNENLQPAPCGKSTCVHGSKAFLFYTCLCLLALGGGGIRGALPALGADQFSNKDSEGRKNIATFFNLLLLSMTVGAAIGVTFVVYASSNAGWDIGFIISMSCSFVGLACGALGRPFYRVRVPGESPLLRIVEVLVVAVKNRKVVPQNQDDLYEVRGSRSTELLPRTDQFRFLNKATIIPKGTSPRKWKVCRVTQVEEVKILARMMPIFLSSIIMNTCLAQLQTFSVQQGTIMNTRIGNFNIPPSSIAVIPLLFMSILIPIYEFIFVPFIRKITGHPNGITHLQRVGVGLVLSAISMAIAGLVEVKRKHEFIHNNYKISVFWLSFQYSTFGIADMFTLAGLMEFFYKEAPGGMRSLSTSFSFLSLSLGYFLSSIFVDIINSVTRKLTNNKIGWLEGLDMNKNHVELFYWFLAILSVLNFANYLFWAIWYKYKDDAPTDEELVLKEAAPNSSINTSIAPSSVSSVSY